MTKPRTGAARKPTAQKTPPLTNRGCLTPNPEAQECPSAILFHPDYLKLTVFADFDEVSRLVEHALLERAGESLGHWFNKGPAQRWECIYEGPGPIHLLVPKTAKRPYTCVELKGEACRLYGPEALQSFLAYLMQTGLDWHGLRLDLAFDHVPFTPKDVDEAIRRGDTNSRCLGAEDRGWVDSPDGRTSYLGRRNQTKTRRLRVYDKRGYTRCEAEYRDEWATKGMRMLAQSPIARWPQEALGLLRGMVDFVDSQANSRLERCPLLPWWAALIGQADRIRNLSEEDRRQRQEDVMMTVVGESERRIMRAARSLWPIRQAYGDVYVNKRLEHYALDCLRPEDHEFVQELKKYRHSGLAGLSEAFFNGNETPI